MFYAPSRIRPDFRQAVRKPAREGSREKRAGESSGQGSLRVSAPPACGKFRAVPGFCPVLAGSPFSAGLMKILPVRPEACLRLPGMPDCKFPVSRGQRQSFHHHDAHVPGAQKSLFPGYRKEALLVIYGRTATYASRDPLPPRASRR